MTKANEFFAALQTIVSHSRHFGREMSLPKRQSPGCTSTATGNYEVIVVHPSSASKFPIKVLRERDVCDSGALVVKLVDGILIDAGGRIGSIASNEELQFLDPPIPTDTVVDSGWSLCSGFSLALNSNSNFFECLSGEFFSVFNGAVNSNCTQVELQASACSNNNIIQQSNTTNTDPLIIEIPTLVVEHLTSATVTLASGTPTTTVATPSISSNPLPSTNAATPSISSSPLASTIAATSNSTLIGVSVGLGVSGMLLLVAVLLWWLVIKKKMIAQKLLASRSESGIAVDYEPGVTVETRDNDGVFVQSSKI